MALSNHSHSPVTSGIPKRQRVMQRLGMSLSTLCAIHCLAMPLVVAFMPQLDSSIAGHSIWVELAIIVASLGLGGSVVFTHWRKRGSQWRSAEFLFLVAATIAGLLSLLLHHVEGHLQLAMSILLLSAILWNWKIIRKSGCQDDACAA